LLDLMPVENLIFTTPIPPDPSLNGKLRAVEGTPSKYVSFWRSTIRKDSATKKA